MDLKKSVTIKEFSDWVDKNKHYTWLIGKDGGFNPDNKGGPLMKYIHPVIDTRDMSIYRITFDREELNVDFRDEDEGESVLDVLDNKIKKMME
jgi:hypothetical protein